MKPLLYAVGDIHGMLDHLKKMVDTIDADIKESGRNAVIIFVGDYVDRGPDSKGVIDLLLQRQSEDTPSRRHVFIMGNHEDMMLNAPGDFFYNGGRKTCDSYGLTYDQLHNYMDFIPREHKDFLRDTHLYYQFDHFVFVHSGIHPAKKVEDNIPFKMMWEREYNHFNDHYTHGYFVIHGHTPRDTIDVKKNQINIDTGCVFGGALTAVRIDPEKPMEKLTFIQVTQPWEDVQTFQYGREDALLNS